MIKELRRLDDLKTEFLSTLSHELRTPMTSISGYLKLLLAGEVGKPNDEQREFLKIIETNVLRLGHLIDDLLDVSKIEEGKIQLNRERVNVAEILKNCRDSFAPQAAEKGLQLRLKVPDNETVFWGDRRAVAQIFSNLISNAVKYTPKGFVEIELDPRDFAVLVKVRDSGVGMDAVDLQNLFSRFYRSRSAIASGESGTGLGMVIARGLTEAMGGKISVESQIGQGTVFTVSLPNLEGSA
jgi:signal transduction histidine kinase